MIIENTYTIDRKKNMELNKGAIVEGGNFLGKVNVHGGGGGGGVIGRGDCPRVILLELEP